MKSVTNLHTSSMKPIVIFFFVVFGFFFVFFTQISPLSVFEMDEWTHNNVTRGLYPEFGKWNPSRVLPEVANSFVADLSNWALKPFIGDYLDSLVVGHSIVISLFIAAFSTFIYRFLVKRFSLKILEAGFLATILTILNLLIFKTSATNNLSVFALDNRILFYFYTLPAMLDIVIVLMIYERNDLSKANKYWGWLILLVYLGVFSNLFTSVILLGWAVLSLFIDIIKRKKQTYIEVIKHNWINLAIIFLFVVSLIFESSGGRAGDFNNINLLTEIKRSIKILAGVFSGVNLLAGLFLLMGILFSIKSIMEKRNPNRLLMVKLLFNSILIILFEIILCARVGSGKIGNTQVTGIIFLNIFIVAIFGWAEIIHEHRAIVNILPIIVMVMFFESKPLSSTTFRPVNPARVNGRVAQQISRDWLNDLLEKYNRGDRSITVNVPKFNGPDNYPLSVRTTQHIAQLLLRHNVISEPISLEFHPDINLNSKYGIHKE